MKFGLNFNLRNFSLRSKRSNGTCDVTTINDKSSIYTATKNKPKSKGMMDDLALAIEWLFGDMDKLGPSGPSYTLCIVNRYGF